MIVREIVLYPELIDSFDFFNDYEDTRQWATINAPELVPILDLKYKEWLDFRS